MNHDRQAQRVEVAVVPAGHGRFGVPARGGYRDHDDLSGFVSVAGGGPGGGMHREAHNEPVAEAAPRSVGREAVIICLRVFDVGFMVLILILAVLAWVL